MIPTSLLALLTGLMLFMCWCLLQLTEERQELWEQIADLWDAILEDEDVR